MAENDMGKRGFSRSKVRVRVKLSSNDGGLPIEGEAEDLSMNGVFIRCQSRIPKDHPCHIEINMDDLVRVDATGTVARLSEDGIAVTFNEINDMESFEHLQQLVLYNNTNPEQVLDEAKHHRGIR